MSMSWRCMVAVGLLWAGSARAAGAEPEADYWDGQCKPCPAKLHKDDHCLAGGTLVGERGCGPLHAYCEGRCRPPQSSPAPKPTFYWDGVCKPCPASLWDHCPEGGKLVGERGCGWLNLLCEGKCEKAARAPEAADWIVVGAGASGCAAAAALADAGENVLVLERGQSDRDPDESDTQKADTWPKVVNTDAVQKIRWMDGVWGAVANVLGGGTSVNGGLYIEEEPEFLTKTFGTDFDLEQFYAGSRYLAQNLSSPLQPSSFGTAVAEALVDSGVGTRNPQPSVRMINGSWIAYSTINTSATDWPRRGAAELLHERAHLDNLRFLTEYQVTKIQFEGQRAVGISVKHKNGPTRTIPARKGVILAAGAIFTPQLLQISGVGDKALLDRLGVKHVAENSQVGRNFVDRNVLPMGVWTKDKDPLFIGYAMAVNRTLGLTVETEGWGQVTSQFALASLALSKPAKRTKALREVLKVLFSTHIADIMNNMVQLVSLQHNTRSRGTVEAQSTDATEAPRVNANFFGDLADLEEQIVAMETLLKVIKTPSMQEFAKPKGYNPPSKSLPEFMSCFSKTPDEATPAIVLPCLPEAGASKARLFEYFRNTVVSSYHYFGTAAYGSVTEGPDFHVKGTDNLHVVDASVFPGVTTVNPQGTIMALGHYVGTVLAKAQRRLGEQRAADVMV